MKIIKNDDPPDWYRQGEELDEDDTRWVNISARWYLGIETTHGYVGVEDYRLVEDWNWSWRLCRIPVSVVWPEKFSHQNPGRLKVARERKDSNLPIIGELVDTNQVRLLDGSHRITVAREDGDEYIWAYVGNPV